jgi:alpha-galactosidase
MLGMDLRRITGKDDLLYKIISNKKLIELNQDSLGIQAKRVYSSISNDGVPTDKDYIQDNERVDVLVKPLSDGGFAVSVINLSETNKSEPFEIAIGRLLDGVNRSLKQAGYSPEDFSVETPVTTYGREYAVEDLWSDKLTSVSHSIQVPPLSPCDSITLKLTRK